MLLNKRSLKHEQKKIETRLMFFFYLRTSHGRWRRRRVIRVHSANGNTQAVSQSRLYAATSTRYDTITEIIILWSSDLYIIRVL